MIELQNDGWALDVEVVDSGGYKQESKFKVTVSRNGQEYTTDYTSGWGNRVWKRMFWSPSDYWARYRKPGKQVRVSYHGMGHGIPCNLKPIADCQKGYTRERQREIFDAFAWLTEPVLPTLPDVMYSLVMDAQCVFDGQTFDSFCDDLGYDNDSRRAEGIFQSCRDTWCALIRLGADFDVLSELFQDY